MTNSISKKELIDRLAKFDIAQVLERVPSLKLYKGFLIRELDGKKLLVIQADKINESKKFMLENNINGLEINMSLGYPKLSIEWLKDFTFLTVLTVIHQPLRNTDEINLLPNLRELSLDSYFYSPIDFNNFPQLEECYVHWTPNAKNLFKQRKLKVLHTRYYNGENASEYAQLENLKDLSIIHSPLTNIYHLKKLKNLKKLELSLMSKLNSLKGIEFLKNLNKLEISSCPKLISLDGISKLINLQELIIDGCRKVDKINELSSLINLKTLSLSNDGAIATLEPIRKLKNLEKLFFIEDTNILDGKLDALTELPNLKKVRFQNRKHYSHRRDLKTGSIFQN